MMVKLFGMAEFEVIAIGSLHIHCKFSSDVPSNCIRKWWSSFSEWLHLRCWYKLINYRPRTKSFVALCPVFILFSYLSCLKMCEFCPRNRKFGLNYTRKTHFPQFLGLFCPKKTEICSKTNTAQVPLLSPWLFNRIMLIQPKWPTESE
jgi:hypothetical protein